jgi:hypothetical protein
MLGNSRLTFSYLLGHHAPYATGRKLEFKMGDKQTTGSPK